MKPGFSPQPIEVLYARAMAEIRATRSIFDLPARSFWNAPANLDLSVTTGGARVATPLGPAAGPHTQLASNLVIAWLAGSRALELKTVQVNDALAIPRPCIDAPDVGYNVEWSQELRLDQSAIEYATGWLLIHLLSAQGIPGEDAGALDLSFEVSVGYDLAGIRSAAVALFLDNLTDAGSLIARLRERLPFSAPAIDIPDRIASTVTLSTFHGCPPEEIERIVEHLMRRHGVNVVVKLNPTLLGYDEVDSLLRERLGYDDIVLDRKAFESDLQWSDALEMFERLSTTAGALGLELGAKLTNTLVVGNTRQRLPGENVYLSGPPLHPLALRLAARLSGATRGRIPLSFSGGITSANFPDTVACGFAPVTACTDLLRPTGYRRLPRYLKALTASMESLGAHTIREFIERRAGESSGSAARKNLTSYADRVLDDPAYQARSRRKPAPRRGTLSLFDCESCNNCLLVCPNDAFFSFSLPAGTIETWDLRIAVGRIEVVPSRLEIVEKKQWAVFVDHCNECGNCDTFCPESGGPFRLKPRFHGSREGFEAAAPGDGILLERAGERVIARMAGVVYTLDREREEARFFDPYIEVTMDAADRVISSRILESREGHTLSLRTYHVLRLLRRAVLESVNPVAAGFLADSLS